MAAEKPSNKKKTTLKYFSAEAKSKVSESRQWLQEALQKSGAKNCLRPSASPRLPSGKDDRSDRSDRRNGNNGGELGLSHSRKALQEAVLRAEGKLGKVQISGRYHRLPKRLEDDYTLERAVLGSGLNGEVRLATSRRVADARFAVKSYRLRCLAKEKLQELEAEAELFLRMDHPHIARLTDAYEEPDMLYLVMEVLEGGELFDRIEARGRFTEKDAAEALYQMLLATNYLHSHGVVHCDYKLENFLYESESSDHLKLIDFGLSKVWEPQKNKRLAASCGTLGYAAPEVLNGDYTSQCDLWSLGVIAFILLSGYMPFSGPDARQIELIKAGKFKVKEQVWSTISSQATDFVHKLLTLDTTTRPTAEEALIHPWIAQRSKLVEKKVDDSIVIALRGFAQASHFRRACMTVMAWSLSSEDRQKVRDAFLQIDTSRQGTITLGELRTALMDKFTIHDEEILRIFHSLDSSQTEEIHYSEFLAAMVSTRIELHDDLLHSTFRRFDTDKSGYISVENLRDVLGDAFDGADAKQLLKEADILKDNRISYDEFIQYMKGGYGLSDSQFDAAHRAVDFAIKKREEEDDSIQRNNSKLRLRSTATSCVSWLLHMTIQRICGERNGQ